MTGPRSLNGVVPGLWRSFILAIKPLPILTTFQDGAPPSEEKMPAARECMRPGVGTAQNPWEKQLAAAAKLRFYRFRIDNMVATC